MDDNLVNLLAKIEFDYRDDYILVKVMPSSWNVGSKSWDSRRYITSDYCVMKSAEFNVLGVKLTVEDFILKVLNLDKSKKYMVAIDQNDPQNTVVMKLTINETKE